VLKDCLSLIIVLIILGFIIFIIPDVLGHSINFEKANFLITPAHIVPEWYLLFFYAVLRSVTNKLLGFLIMVFSIFILFFLPYFLKGQLIRSGNFRPIFAILF
jgi:ubiquinol-cytochrome c reductase cytochrome b subunit